MAGADPTSAARRVAEDVRAHPSHVCHAAMCVSDLRALLPILDAVAAAGSDAVRVERWARVMCSAAGLGPDTPSPDIKGPCWLLYETDAKRALALADAERAAEAQRQFAKASAEIDRRADEISARVAEGRAKFQAADRGPTGRFKL